MAEREPDRYTEPVQLLIRQVQQCELDSGSPNRLVLDQLRALRGDSLCGQAGVADQEMAECCVSGLWLRHNYLDESHEISQRISSSTGSYWHGIMHRREPDFSNAKYWFRQVGEHAIYPQLSAAARQLAVETDCGGPAEYLATQSDWDPSRFVDLCESVSRGSEQSESVCRHVAEAEWQLLFAYCYQQASGGHG